MLYTQCNRILRVVHFERKNNTYIRKFIFYNGPLLGETECPFYSSIKTALSCLFYFILHLYRYTSLSHTRCINRQQLHLHHHHHQAYHQQFSDFHFHRCLNFFDFFCDSSFSLSSILSCISI